MRARQRRREPLHDVDIGVVERQQIRAERRTEDENEDDHRARERETVAPKTTPRGLAGRELNGGDGRSRHR
ncbi:hypothetical protein ABIA44_006226 [Bradyrhizobium sp. USDA 329]